MVDAVEEPPIAGMVAQQAPAEIRKKIDVLFLEAQPIVQPEDPPRQRRVGYVRQRQPDDIDIEIADEFRPVDLAALAERVIVALAPLGFGAGTRRVSRRINDP
jgi:hypothetical protein